MPPLGPARYLTIGVGLFVLKFVLDRLVAGAFGRDWDLLNYLIPHETYTLLALPRADRWFFLVMLGVALPFAATGIALTWRRLHDANLSRWLVLLFFVPVVNLVLFSVLSFYPSQIRTHSDAAMQPEAPDHDVRRSWFASFTLGVLAGAGTATLLTVATILVFHSYGWGAFVAAPFVAGLMAAWVHGLPARRTASESMAAGTCTLVVGFLVLFVTGFEGLVCLLMAAPLAFMVTALGALLGHSLQLDRHRGQPRVRGFEVLPIVSLPLLLMGAERLRPPVPVVHSVTTSLIVDATPAVVWEHVLRFPELAPPTDWLFTSGIAYPVRARIEGAGVGAVRYCEFSTGAFVEPITVWKPPTAEREGLLRFAVTHNPPPLREWSWRELDPPHLDGFLMSRQGQFRLVPLDDGCTLLEGTTWYTQEVFPSEYWRLWSDAIIGRIHHRVLNHVAELAESEARAVSNPYRESPAPGRARELGYDDMRSIN